MTRIENELLRAFYQNNQKELAEQTYRPEVNINSYESFVNEMRNELTELCFQMTGHVLVWDAETPTKSKFMDLKTFLNHFDFDYEIVEDHGKKQVALIDLQGANLGNIEQDRFAIGDDTVAQIIDRMDVYIHDSVIVEFEEALSLQGIDAAEMSLAEMVDRCKALSITEDISYALADAVLHPNQIQFSEINLADENPTAISLDQERQDAHQASHEITTRTKQQSSEIGGR